MDNKLQEIRESRKLTQEQLSELTGMHVSQISRLETGKRGLNIRNLEVLARALNCKPADIISSSITGLSEGFTQSFQPGYMKSAKNYQNSKVNPNSMYEAYDFLLALYRNEKPPKEEVELLAKKMDAIAEAMNTSFVDSNLATYAWNLIQKDKK